MLRTIIVFSLLAVLVSGRYGAGPFDHPVPSSPGCAATLCAPGFQCVERAVNCFGISRCPPTTECVPIQSNGGCAATLCRQGTHCIEGVLNCFVGPCPVTVLTECIDNLPGGIGCASLLCAPGFKCVERAVNCFGLTQCPPSAKCVPTTGHTTRPGCPVLPPSTVGICVDLCSRDADCRAGSSCCSNGCGRVCNSAGGPIREPIVIPPPISINPFPERVCPSYVPSSISRTSRMCAGDFMCQNSQICCSTSNGKRCISTGGSQQRPSRLPIGIGFWQPYNNNFGGIRPIG